MLNHNANPKKKIILRGLNHTEYTLKPLRNSTRKQKEYQKISWKLSKAVLKVEA